jgi:lipopolysaccharide/colanic/teichoic acid biosynthesis glycosyltransferase
MINLDIEYSERSSLWLDLKIMLKTVPALVVQCCDQRAKRKQDQKPALQGMVTSHSPNKVSPRVNVAG